MRGWGGQDGAEAAEAGRPEVVDDGGVGADGGFEGDEEVGGNGRVGGEAIGEELEDGED